MPLILMFALSLAHAGPPDRVAFTTELGTGISDVDVSSDGHWVAALETSTGQARLFDAWSWEEADSLAPCSGATATSLALWEDGDEVRLYVGCSDGTVNYGTIEDRSVVLGEGVLDLGAGKVDCLVESNLAILAYAEPIDGTENTTEIHHIDPSNDGIDETTGYPSSALYSGCIDADANDSYALAAHGTDNVSQTAVASGNTVLDSQGQVQLDTSDVLLMPNGNFLLSGGSAVVEWTSGSDQELDLIISSADGLEDVGGMALVDDDSTLVLADSGPGEFLVLPVGSSSGLPSTVGAESFDYPSDWTDALPVEGVSAGDYAIFGTNTGELWVLTDAPWVAATVSADVGYSGDVLSFSFSADEAGDYDIYLGGSGTDGELLDSGSVDADEPVFLDVTVDDRFDEGDNPIWVNVTGSNGSTGHDVAWVTVDNPPSQPQLSDNDLGFGNEELTLAFDGISDSDVDYYIVYISVTEFSADDYEEMGDDGPEFDGDDALGSDDFIITLDSAGDPIAADASIEHIISPLTNDVVYYVAVRAVDDAGQEGPMSNVLSEMPQETFGAWYFAGEEGGMCGTAAPISAALALFGGLVAVGRRRRGTAAAFGLGVLALGLSTPAQAADDSDPSDRTITRGSVAVRAGAIDIQDQAIEDVFGETDPVLIWLEAGPTIGSVLEFNLGLGYAREKGFLLTEDKEASDEIDKMTFLPVTLGATLRLDFLEEQVIVPAISAGGDYWLWREKWGADTGPDTHIGGAKYGWHWAASAQILLDSFDRDRASKLQARSGIDDSYLVVEYRDQSVGDWQTGFDFGATSWSVGVKVRY